MNRWLVFIFVLVAVVILYQLYPSSEKDFQISEVCFGENCFNVEIADTKEERALGLMNREQLCENCGMLFVYETPGDYKFWMKNTLIPLDIIWLDSELKVIHIANAVPCVTVTEECELYGPDEDSIYILEINSDISKEISLEKGSELELVYS